MASGYMIMHSCIIVSFVFVLINTKSMRVTNAQSLPTRSDLCFSDSFQFFRIHDLNNGPHVALCVNVSNPSVMKGVYIPGVRSRLATITSIFSLMHMFSFLKVVLDIYSFVLLLTNALSKPRSMSERLLSILWSDGLIFFLVGSKSYHLCYKSH